MVDEFRLRGLRGSHMAVAQIQLRELPLHVLELNLGVPVQRHRDALMGQDRLEKLRIQTQLLSHGGESLSKPVRMNALHEARGLLDALACPPCILTVRFLARSSRGIFAVTEQESRLIGSRSEMLLEQFRQSWVQRNRDRLATFDDGFNFHPVEIYVPHP